jgi:hypothetical protein
MSSKFNTEDAQILGATVQNVVTTATWHPDLCTPAVTCIVQCERNSNLFLNITNCLEIRESKNVSANGMTRI